MSLKNIISIFVFLSFILFIFSVYADTYVPPLPDDHPLDADPNLVRWDSEDREWVWYRDHGDGIMKYYTDEVAEWVSSSHSSMESVDSMERFHKPKDVTDVSDSREGTAADPSLLDLSLKRRMVKDGDLTDDGYVRLRDGNYIPVDDSEEPTGQRITIREYNTQRAKTIFEENPASLTTDQIILLQKSEDIDEDEEKELNQLLNRRRVIDTPIAATYQDWSSGLNALFEITGWGVDREKRREEFYQDMRRELQESSGGIWSTIGLAAKYGEAALVESCAMGQFFDLSKFFVDDRGIDRDAAAHCPTEVCVRVSGEVMNLSSENEPNYVYLISLLVVPPKGEEWKYTLALSNSEERYVLVDGHVGIEENKADQFIGAHMIPYMNETRFDTLTLTFLNANPRDYITDYSSTGSRRSFVRTIKAVEEIYDPNSPPPNFSGGSSRGGRGTTVHK